jgi:hypothetical protein
MYIIWMPHHSFVYALYMKMNILQWQNNTDRVKSKSDLSRTDLRDNASFRYDRSASNWPMARWDGLSVNT